MLPEYRDRLFIDIVVRSATFPHRNIHKTSNQIDHILVERSRHSSIFQGSWLWYWSLSGGWKVRERSAVSKQAAQKFDVEKFNLMKLSELAVS